MSEEKRVRVDVKHVVRTAVAFVKDVYSEEKITNVGLEEVRSEEGVWLVTVGFSRPWDYPKVKRSVYDITGGLLPSTEPVPTRDYKVVRIDAESGEVLGMEIREDD
jgi:hypothetical protein